MKSLRKIRLEKGIHLAHVSQDTEITIPMLSNIERGSHVANNKTRKSLERYFDQKINWLDVPINIDPKVPA